MNLAQALEVAGAISLPGFFSDEAALNQERLANEEALALLVETWRAAPLGHEPFSFDLVLTLADKNRAVCDAIGADRLRDVPSPILERRLSDEDLCRAVAWLQKRPLEDVVREAGPEARDLGIAYIAAPVSGTVCGFDIETTSKDPVRGYIVNAGVALMELTPKAKPKNAYAAYFGIPDRYAETGVPLSDIHHITWKDVAGKVPFRENRAVHEALLATFTTVPLVAHNAAFEDTWLTFNLPGYAQARKEGKIVIIDSRDVCRRLDPDVRTLPRESSPASLENWALRRKTLKPGQAEKHLGLDDVKLMLRTMQAEFKKRKLFPGMRDKKK